MEVPVVICPGASYHEQQRTGSTDESRWESESTVTSPTRRHAQLLDADSTCGNSESGMCLVISRLDAVSEQLSCILQWQVQVDASLRDVRDELHIVSSASSVASENVEIPRNPPLLPRLLGKASPSSASFPMAAEKKMQDNIKVLEMCPEDSRNTSAAGCMSQDVLPNDKFEEKVEEQSIPLSDSACTHSRFMSLAASESATMTPQLSYSGPPRRVSFESPRTTKRSTLFKSLTGGRRSRQKRMRTLIAAAEDMEEVEKSERQSLETRRTISYESLTDILRNTKSRKARLEGNVDNIAAGFISLNVIVIALSCDYEWPGWFWIDVGFACVFAMELVAKLWINGLRAYFLGDNCRTNIFDATIVAMDVVQIILAFAYGSPVRESKFLSASLFRFARLARLFRVVRAFQAYFHDLSVMIGGLAGGASTLCWAIVVIVIPVFVCSVLMKQLVENMEDSSSFDSYFSSVTRSMFTMFRCGFGDCNNEYGQPIFVLAWQSRNYLCVLVYCVFMFIITNGLFNVISAIFVDNVVATSVREEKSKRLGRLKDEGLFASRVTVLLRCILRYLKVDVSGKLTDIWSMITKLEVSAEAFAQIIQDPQVVVALKDLDIQEADHAGLFNMLDADKSGRLLCEELVEGLESLRGEPRRSDIVALDLMLRSVQHKVDTILDLSTINVKNVSISMQRRSSII